MDCNWSVCSLEILAKRGPRWVWANFVTSRQENQILVPDSVKLLSPSTHTRHHPFCLYVHLCVCVSMSSYPWVRRGCVEQLEIPYFLRVKDLQRDGLMGWVTSLGQFKWKTIPEITTLDQGPRDFDTWICPSWGNKQHLKKCVYLALYIRFRKAPYSLAFQTLIGPVFFPWSWLLEGM